MQLHGDQDSKVTSAVLKSPSFFLQYNIVSFHLSLPLLPLDHGIVNHLSVLQTLDSFHIPRSLSLTLFFDHRYISWLLNPSFVCRSCVAFMLHDLPFR